VLPVALTFHLELGPFGSSGNTGFFYRENSCVINYPHCELHMTPYVDRQDYSWLLTNKDEKMFWTTEFIDRNTGVSIFNAGQKIYDAPSFPHSEVIVKRFTFNNTLGTFNSLFEDWYITLFGTAFDRRHRRLVGDEVECYVHLDVAENLSTSFSGKVLEGSVLRDLHAKAEKALAALYWAPMLRKLKPDWFTLLVAGTVNQVVEHSNRAQLLTSSYARSQSQAARTAYENFANVRIAFPLLYPMISIAVLVVVLVLLIVYFETGNHHLLYPFFIVSVISTVWVAPYVVKRLWRVDVVGLIIETWTNRTIILAHYLRENVDPLVDADRAGQMDYLPSPGIHNYGIHRRFRHTVAAPPPSVLREHIQIAHVDYVNPETYSVTFNRTAEETATDVFYGPSCALAHYTASNATNMIGLFYGHISSGPMADSAQRDAVDALLTIEHKVELLIEPSWSTVLITASEVAIWLQTRPSHKQKIYLHEYLKLESLPTTAALTPNTVDVFSKTDDLLLKSKNRPIDNVHASIVVANGPYIDIASHRLKMSWDGNQVFNNFPVDVKPIAAYGCDPSELNIRLRRFVDSTTTVTFVVAGDDSILKLVYQRQCPFTKRWSQDVLYVEGDASKYDKSQGLGLLQIEYSYLAKFGVPPDVVASIHAMHEAPCRFRNPEDKTQTIVVRGPPVRKTGGPDTTFGNSVIMGHVLAYAANYALQHVDPQADAMALQKSLRDAMTAFLARVGLTMKFTKYSDNPYSVCFLKGFICPNIDNTEIYWAPSVARVLKLGCSRSQLFDEWYKSVKLIESVSLVERARQHMADVLAGYACYTNLPFFTQLWAKYKPFCTGRIISQSYQQIHNPEFIPPLDYSYQLSYYDIDGHPDLEPLLKFLACHEPGFYYSTEIWHSLAELSYW
jgi:hypothetical protein